MARQMKDSGIEWIGEIPESWGVYRAKYLFQTGDGALRIGPFGSALSGKALAEGPYKIYNQAHLVSNDFSLCRHFVSEETYQDLQSYEVAPGDILFSMMGTIGKCRVMPTGQQRGIMDSHLLKARLNDLVIPRFFEYVYDKDLSPIGIGQLSFFSNGSIMAGLNSSIVKNVSFPLPTVAEQQCIAAFLDRKCVEIDAVIQRTKATIEEYKKLKQAVITEAVTKGVRGARKMKESRIEWLDLVPYDWTECRIKNVIFPQEKPITESDEVITCFRDGEVTLRKNRREDGFTVSFTEHGYHGVDVGDLVIHGMDAFAGAIGCSDSRGKTTPVVHVCSTVGNNRYFMYFLRSMAYGDILMDLSNGVRIRSSDYRNFAKLGVFGITVPPIEEQNEIVGFLDRRCVELDTLIAKKTALLTELETYKKSLIYEYVTGKKEVV